MGKIGVQASRSHKMISGKMIGKKGGFAKRYLFSVCVLRGGFPFSVTWKGVRNRRKVFKAYGGGRQGFYTTWFKKPREACRGGGLFKVCSFQALTFYTTWYKKGHKGKRRGRGI